MPRAVQANEMGMLGDLHVATRSPLRLRLIADPTRKRTMGENGEVGFTIGGVELYCGKRRLTAERERALAMWLMVYGGWEEEATARIRNGELTGVDFIRMPQEDHGQGFEFVGTLSSLFSSWYLGSTSDADRVTRLGIKVTGGSLGSLIDQLFGYAGWRDTKLAIVIFVREKGLTSIVAKADDVLWTSAIRGLEGRGDRDGTPRNGALAGR